MIFSRRPVLGLLAGLVIGPSLSGCAYSSSETPRPLEPDYERTVAQRRAKPIPSGSEATSVTDIPEEDPRVPAVRPATSWGRE